MKTSTTAERLAQYMKIYQMRQVDILEAVAPYSKDFGVKIQKSEISQYLSGKFEPGNDKIYVLSVALGLNPLWLMGYDEPMYKTSEQEKFKHAMKEEKPIPENELNKELVSLLADLTPQETTRVADFVSGLKAARAEAASLHKKGQK